MNLKHIRPMKAEKLDKLPTDSIRWKEWVAEEKYDGNRVIIVVDDRHAVRAYNRPRKKNSDVPMELCEELPKAAHLLPPLALLPIGVYDGELMAGDTATDVKRKDLAHARVVTLFDVLYVEGHSVMSRGCDERRSMLEMCHHIMKAGDVTGTAGRHVKLAARFDLKDRHDVARLAQSIWKAGGEGLIVKRRASIYQPDKRSTDWIKIKKLEHYVMTVTGFEPTRGTVLKRGPFAVAKLRSDDGVNTTCKTKDDFELERLEKAFRDKYGAKTNVDMATLPHPWVGRRLVIECGGRTRDGGYKGPVIWDRWENE